MNKPTITPSENPTPSAALVNGTSTRKAKPHGMGKLQVEDTAEARSRALLAAVVAFRDGDFTVRLPADWAGTEGRIAEAFNQALAHEDRIAREVARLSVTVGKDGRLQQRMSAPGAIGGWAQKVDSLNTLLDDLVRPTTEVARAPSARWPRAISGSPWSWRWMGAR